MSYLRQLAGLAVATLAAGALVALPGTTQAAPAVDNSANITEAVTAKLLDQAEAVGAPANRQNARVTINRRDGHRWAFGTAVLVAPKEEGAYPIGAVFVARSQGRAWQVAFDGEATFGELAAESPVVTAAEKQIFTSSPSVLYANGDYRTGMALPFATGQTWTMTGGPHGWAGYDSPWSSIDLAGGDQVVRATRAGTAYTMCKGWIRVIHDRGYATDYYHLWDNISVNGSAVSQGAFLGYTGTDVTCGGSASGRHVHFGLRQNNAYVPITGHDIGKWVFYNGGSAYQGGARHGSYAVGVGGGLYNYGALGFNQGVVDANGGGSVNKRSGPGTGYAVVGSVADGATVTVSCSANGTSHSGRYGTTSLWNRLSDGTWISDAYLWTGLSGPVNGWC
ncbi:MAG TPA: peptidoglycan DD-metalloendopeptidase family protein [Micromonosporaceae bacterium]|nr:peptidoglycan DD-metalloendopeptidase family protein [Micromonosporaceae bacterium]